MEIGWTLPNGWTLAMLHTFIQNKGFFGGPEDGPDLIGGWMLQLKVPVVVPELVLKFAAGLGGTHDQSDGIKAHAGPGLSAGLDFHVPLGWRGHGVTLGITAIRVWAQGTAHTGAGIQLGYTLF